VADRLVRNRPVRDGPEWEKQPCSWCCSKSSRGRNAGRLLRYAGMLRPELLRIDGFLDNRRFRSRRHEGRLLSSHSGATKSVVRWRSHEMHHGVQQRRSEVFATTFKGRRGGARQRRTQPQSRFDETETAWRVG